MKDYAIRYRDLSGPNPESPQRLIVSAANEQAAIAALKDQMPGAELRIERVSSDAPAPKKRKTRAEWIILALVVVIGGINLLTRMGRG